MDGDLFEHQSTISGSVIAAPAAFGIVALVNPSYRERLQVPLRWWAQATMLVASAWLAFLVATPGWVTLLATCLIAALTAALLLWIGAARVEVAEGMLRAGRAQIPLTFIGTARVLDSDQTHTTLGTQADARAYLLTRPYLKGSVQVPINDPADPTPYWLISSRHPMELAAALNSPDQHNADHNES